MLSNTSSGLAKETEIVFQETSAQQANLYVGCIL